MSDDDFAEIGIDTDDPNAATQNQLMLKRVESLVRRRGGPELILLLDEIALEKDPARVRRRMLDLKTRLETKDGAA